MSLAIKVENLSKAYQLGEIGTGTISRDIERWVAKVRGKEDPFLRIGETNDRAVKGTSDVVWSLKDINFEIQEGDAVGIIGRNGAGKSTLLKILSRVTSPTTGSIKIKGRIASLLEVGTGFHPELTGRENIFLNGAILGMRKKEIIRKFEEILDFAGVERYVDTPVKKYSSGMYVRLAFAVAAYLESEILIVDEVLAVGDAEFQKKCLGKMGEVTRGEGRTVLFVSHNMGAIKNLCSKLILLENGEIVFSGCVSDGIQKYLTNSQKEVLRNTETLLNRSGNGKIMFSSFNIENLKGQILDIILTGEDVVFVFKLKVYDKEAQKVDLGFSLHDPYGEMQTYLYSSFQDIYFRITDTNNDYLTVRCFIKEFPFTSGKLTVRGRILVEGMESDWLKEDLGVINIQEGDFFETGKSIKINSPFLIKGIWE